jgi:hypothetical protein
MLHTVLPQRTLGRPPLFHLMYAVQAKQAAEKLTLPKRLQRR